MDIISHTLTGVAIGTVFSSVSKNPWKEKTLILFTVSLGVLLFLSQINSSSINFS